MKMPERSGEDIGFTETKRRSNTGTSCLGNVPQQIRRDKHVVSRDIFMAITACTSQVDISEV
jgi:hypothetical protein